MKRTFLSVGLMLISGVCLSLSAKKAPAASTQTSTQSEGYTYKTTCGALTPGVGPEAFRLPWEYEEYLLNLNYVSCGEYGLPEMFERPYPTTEPDASKPTPAQSVGASK